MMVVPDEGRRAEAPQSPRSLFSLICTGVLAALERVTLSARRPTVASLLSIAERQTGLSDLGDDWFLAPLAFLLQSIEREAKLNALGRFVFDQHIIQLLRNRLYLQLDCQQDRGIYQRRIRKPVFITGLPRTGTTLLHALLAQDGAIFAAPSTWEVIYPSPRQGDSRARIQRAERELKWFDRLVPKFRRIHPISAQLPQECVAIMSHCFMSQEFDTMFDLPRYECWLEAQDLRRVYAFHKQFLQHLHPGTPERRFVLKAPAHLSSVEAILSVYPDAQIIHTYRDPLQVLPSLANLSFSLKSAFSYAVDPVEVGAEMVDYCLRNLRKFFASVDRLPASFCTDVAYTDLVKDPLSIVRQIYARLGERLTPEAESRMVRFLKENPQAKWGRHIYSAATFGLATDAIEDEFRFYTERFDMASRSEPVAPSCPP